jgi:transketolase
MRVNEFKQGNLANISSELAKSARIEILQMTHDAKASHVGSALSVVDILAVLYSAFANINPSNIDSVDRDVVILSKGHACTALYAVLSLREFFPNEWLRRYCTNGAELSGHVTSAYVPGVELSTGSLGHGLPYGLGIQLSRQRYGVHGRTYVIMSDGECDEGTTWESALLANHHGLDKLFVIVDRNQIQSMGSTENTLALEPFDLKWRAFGWNVIEVDGHDHNQLRNAFEIPANGKPTCVIANTLKGKGIDFMENQVLWHYRPPSTQDLNSALLQLSSESL